METNNLGKSIHEIFDNQNKYIIPLYQRNFSWRREHIEQLLQDIYAAYKQNQKHYYIGSLVVLKRSNGDFEVIDGQQRLTVLSLITKILGINKEPRLYYDSRPEVEEFFKAFYNSVDGSCNIDYSQTAHLRNAIDFIKEIDLDAEKQTGRINEANEIKNQEVSFSQYFENNVILVLVEIPQDTDVASYFEIMNNRGAQLQKHEILKSFMLSNLKGKSPKEFSKIWTACSQMDTPIQKLFVIEDRRKYFGENYDDFCFKGLTESDIETNDGKYNTLDDILKEVPAGVNTKDDPEDFEVNDDETKYKSIIDFPNFLMHVFKVMFPGKVKYSNVEEKEIPLNEKYLISTYKAISSNLKSEDLENFTEDFIKTLFFCRTLFDRYIVKTLSDNNSEDGERWTLRKPKKENGKWYYVNTFDDEYKQNRIVKALTMLQVSYRTRIYKNWLCEILNWFRNEKNTIEVDYTDYLKKLDYIILNCFNNIAEFGNGVPEFIIIEEGNNITKENSYSKGLSTPHFLFNFIDYLYWVDSGNANKINSTYKINDFDFKYWNSIEHHMAREWASRNSEKVPQYDNYIDNLGNLCLISKSTNSRLSDRDAKEKAETFDKGNLGANRQIMYKITKNNYGNYREEQIKQHYNELLNLLSKRKEILDFTDD